MSFIDAVRASAAATPRRVVFSESGDPRVLEAVRRLRDGAIVDPILVLDPEHPEVHAAAAATGVATIDPTSDQRGDAAVELLVARRGHKGLTRSDAERYAREPVFFAAALVAAGDADASVAGAVYTTGDVLRAALWCIGPARGVRTVSSAFYMVVPPFRETGASGEEVLTFTDCAVVVEPTPDQLADIAIAAAADRRRIVGDDPVVALLSFSTKGSADAPSVQRVRAAVDVLHTRGVDFPVDGELQGDAALVPSVGARKAPGSSVAGRANVLVFPSLDAGNLAYKLVQRLGGAQAIGPIVQGLARPCCDLSRGATADDIISVAAIAALQARPPVTPGVGTPRWERHS